MGVPTGTWLALGKFRGRRLLVEVGHRQATYSLSPDGNRHYPEGLYLG